MANYPLIASVYVPTSTQQVGAFSAQNLVVGSPQDRSPSLAAALHAANPALAFLLTYSAPQVTLDEQSPLLLSGGLYVYPGWYLLLAPRTTLAVALTDTTTTSVTVTSAAPFSVAQAILIDGESMLIGAIVGNVLTVTRGYYSTATTHSAGAFVAAHAISFSSAEWVMNVTAQCPVDPGTGYTWTQYLANTASTDFAAGIYTGVYFDNIVSACTALNAANTAADANNDGVADNGNGSSPTGWVDGITSLLIGTIARLPTNTTVIGNGGSYPAIPIGVELENFYQNQGNTFAAGFAAILAAVAVNPNVIVNAGTLDTGTINYQNMRLTLGMALLAGAYYAYDYGDTDHGQPWEFDEYDSGVGSCLAASAGSGDATITVSSGTGMRFAVGDVLLCPHTPDMTQVGRDVEYMQVTAITGDILPVRRGVSGSVAGAHPAGYKVFTQAQRNAGRGWLGPPTGAYVTLAANLYQRTFAGGMVVVNGTGTPQTVVVGTGYATLLGTQAPAINTGSMVSVVTVPALDALLLIAASIPPTPGSTLRSTLLSPTSRGSAYALLCPVPNLLGGTTLVGGTAAVKLYAADDTAIITKTLTTTFVAGVGCVINIGGTVPVNPFGYTTPATQPYYYVYLSSSDTLSLPSNTTVAIIVNVTDSTGASYDAPIGGFSLPVDPGVPG